MSEIQLIQSTLERTARRRRWQRGWHTFWQGLFAGATVWLFVLATIYLLANAIIDPSSRWATLAVMGVTLLGIPVFYLTVGRRPTRVPSRAESAAD